MDIENTGDYQLEKNTDQDSALNFEFLRARGIELVQKYAGTAWTDYNLHDPGVTILEYLCYAITDLAYRTNFDIEDILTEKDGTIDLEKNLFFLKKEILTTNPVLVDDLRKLVIDQVQEVYNVWIERVTSPGGKDYMKGLYRVFIQPVNDEIQESFEGHTEEERQAFRKGITDKVKAVLNGARNLGFDYESFSILEPCDVKIEADIVVDRHGMHEEMLAQVYDVLIQTLNPPINFYTEAGLREKGMATEDIYQGPALLHGFIIDEEMTEKVSIVDPSDLTKAILGIDGVKYLRKLVVTIDGVQNDQKPFYIGANMFPRFLFNLEQPTIRLFNDSYEVVVKKTIFSSLLHKKLDSNKRKYIQGYSDPATDIIKGEYRNITLYQSIQYLFPPVYRINIDEIENARTARSEQNPTLRSNQAKAKQLKGYLMLFEQVLTNFLAQLNNIGEILSPNLEIGSRHHTYFAQPLYDVPAAGNILSDFMKPGSNATYSDWERFKEDTGNGYIQLLEKTIESDDVFRERKKRLLDHMLSRFNINLLKYPVQLYDRLYKPQGETEQNIELKWKAGILKNLVTLTRNRNQAFDYTAPLENNTSGFENIMRAMLYLEGDSKKRISDVFEKLSGGKVTIKKNEVSSRSAGHPASYEVNWDGQRLDMLIEEEEMNRLLSAPEEAPEEEDDDGEIKEKIPADEMISVPRKSIIFLKEGIDYANYRIGPEINSKGFIILYRSPSDRQWSRVGKYETRDKAMAGLNDFINTLKTVSTETEGFHLVEHILLRPSLESKSFGFEFHDEKGETVFKHKQWYSFEERRKVLQAILDVVGTEEPSAEELTALLNNTCTMVKGSEALSSEVFDHFMRRLINSLRESQNVATVLYPCFRNTVKNEEGTQIAEDFFRFRITVVFPLWPARFQEKAFRQFAENLFRENSPAHIRIDFKWLSVNGMQKFEEHYFNWIESLRTSNETTNNRQEADKLVTLLGTDLR
ncbi:MAG: hypothetical protein V4539_03720 [Bacteroidota bacterium]